MKIIPRQKTGKGTQNKTTQTHNLNDRATHKTTKHYYEPLANCSPTMAPNLIEVVPESNKH